MGSNSDFVMNFEQMIHYKDSNQYFFGNSESLWYCPSQPKNLRLFFTILDNFELSQREGFEPRILILVHTIFEVH